MVSDSPAQDSSEILELFDANLDSIYLQSPFLETRVPCNKARSLHATQLS